MSEFLIQHVQQIHIYEIFGMAILISFLECIFPLRSATDAQKLRWVGNFAMMIVGFLVVGIALPMFGYGWASYCEKHGYGLFHHLSVPVWFSAIVTFLLLDLLMYVRHRLSHRWSLLWRLHRLHHTDREIDFTTTLRFHPLEALLMVALEGGLIAVLEHLRSVWWPSA
jgi:sterol desaturase/sphingolipid hydroxylase (fatty acid hydroxylase superfamily)